MDFLDFSISLMITLLMFLFGGIILHRSLKNQRMAFTLIISLFFGMLAALTETLRVSLNVSFDKNVFLFLSLLLWCFMYLSSLIFFQQLNSDKINYLVFSIALVFLVNHFIFGIFYLYNIEDFILNNVVIILWDFFYDALGALTFIFGAYVHFKIYKKTKEKPGLWLGIALSFISFGFIWAFSGDLVITLKNVFGGFEGFFGTDGLFYNYLMLGDIFKIFGIIAFVLYYIININYIFRLPYSIDSVMVFNRIGLFIYAAIYSEIKNEELEKIPIELITAALDAFSTFITETTGSRQPLEKIVTGDKQVIIKTSELISVAVVAEKSTFFLNLSMKKLIKNLENQYRTHLSKNYTDSSYYSDISNFIYDAFPYLSLPFAEQL